MAIRDKLYVFAWHIMHFTMITVTSLLPRIYNHFLNKIGPRSAEINDIRVGLIDLST